MLWNRSTGGALLCVMWMAAVSGCGVSSSMNSNTVLGTESHGTGGMLDRNNPWFLVAKDDSRKIEYCVEVDRTSVEEPSELEELVEQALTQWRVFFDRYEVDKQWFGDGAKPFLMRFLDGKPRQLARNFTKVPQCTDPKTQLRFLFGPRPPTGESVDGRWSTARGAAVRVPYNHDSYWNGGTVWVHNRYREGRRLVPRAKLHILLHELGHVFGFRHNEMWAMYENAADESFESKVPGQYSEELGVIELPYWRFRLLPQDEIQFRFLEVTGVSGGESDAVKPERALFEELGAKGETVVEKLIFDGVDKDNKKNFRLQLRELLSPGTVLTELRGKFHGGRYEKQLELPHGPGVFTRWAMGGQVETLLGALWMTPDVVPANGVFTTADGKKRFEAQIGFRYGTTLFISLPEREKWMRWRSNNIQRAHGKNDWDY